VVDREEEHERGKGREGGRVGGGEERAAVVVVGGSDEC